MIGVGRMTSAWRRLPGPSVAARNRSRHGRRWTSSSGSEGARHDAGGNGAARRRALRCLAQSPGARSRGDDRGVHLGLGDVPYAVALLAARRLIRTSTFFPAPFELRRAVAEDTLKLPTSEEAWRQVRDGIRAGGL